MKPQKYKAKDLQGNWVIGYDIVPALFNDEERSNGGYWHTVNPDTLQEIPDLFGRPIINTIIMLRD